MWDPNWYQSAHERLKTRQPRYLLCSVVVALILMGAGVMISPPYVPAPYALSEPVISKVLPPQPIDVPPKPKEIATPELPMSFEPSDDPDAVETIPPTENPFGLVPPPAPALPSDAPYPSATEPVVVLQVEPEYPRIAREAHAEGMVEVQVSIDVNGRVIGARIYTSDTVEALEVAALQAARQYLFTPCLQNDVPVPCQVVLRFSFYLR